MPLIPVLVTCDPEDNSGRLLMRVTAREVVRKQGFLMYYGVCEGKKTCIGFGKSWSWSLDVFNLSPHEAAQNIVEHITKVTGMGR